jgi:NAD(P)-dependent dehydrogenase (short-subunit alcohol dehydrogenase family)
MKGLIRLVDSHLNSQLKGSQHYEKRGGVLGTTSVHEESAWSGCSAYTASKAAVSPE